MIWIAVTGLIIALDQISKEVIRNRLDIGEFVKVIDRFFYISHYENSGAAWSIFQNGRAFLIPVSIIVSLGIIYWLYKERDRFHRIALSFILGGAIGNLIDRITKGTVTDFLEFHFGSYVFPIFNMADTFIVVGSFLLAICILIADAKKAKEKKE